MGSRSPGRALGISRASVLLRVARAENSLQEDGTRRVVGDHSAVRHDDHVQPDLWTAGQGAIRWAAVSDLRVLCPAPMAAFFICTHGVEQQRGRTAAATDEGLFPAAAHAA